MKELALVLTTVLGLGLVACGTDPVDVAGAGGPSGAVEHAPEQGIGSLTCPESWPVPPEDAGPKPDSEAIVLSGDFDGEPWCVKVSHFGDQGPCVSIRGGDAPEGERLSGGACVATLTRLGFYTTGQPTGFIVYGHAPADATWVQLVSQGSGPVEVKVHHSPHADGATFFATQLPAGFSPPHEAAAFAGDQEIARKQAPVGRGG